MLGRSVTAFKACVGASRKYRMRIDTFRLFVAVVTLSFATVGGSGVATADTFNFAYTGSGISASGILTASLQSPGQYQITGITGTRNGSTITALLAPNTYAGTGFSNNNTLFFPNNPGYVDINGFAYAAGGTNYNPYYLQGTYYESAGGAINGSPLTSFTVTRNAAGAPAPTPGGGLLSLLALGIFGFAYGRKQVANGMRRYLAASNLAASNKRTMHIAANR